MSVKIFSDSDNIYQDQARILFDFYAKSAEKIVDEEMRIEGEIKKHEEQIEELTELKRRADGRKTMFLVLGIALGAAAIIGAIALISQTGPAILAAGALGFLPIIGFFTGKSRARKYADNIAEEDEEIVRLKKQHADIFRDYRVTKLGVVYVPVADRIKYGDKSFIVDYTGNVADSRIELQIPKNSELLSQSVSNLEDLSATAPLVETSDEVEEISTDEYSRSIQRLNQHDYFGTLDRTLRTMAFCVGDMNTVSVELPLVENGGGYAQFLKEYSTSETPENAPVFEAFDRERHQNSIEKFKEINKLRESVSDKTDEFEDTLKNLMITVANAVQKISAMKLSSADKVVSESNRILFKILKSPYNHYSPALESEELDRIRNEDFNFGKDESVDYQPFHLKESSRVRYDLLSEVWQTEDGSRVISPFGVHQIYQEIVAPMVQNLMGETRKDRLAVYNHIRDQKSEYLTQWHRDVDDFYGRNRAEAADLRNIMAENLRKYTADYNTLASLKNTEQSMNAGDTDLDSAIVKNKNNVAETLIVFDRQASGFKQVQADFDDYMDRLKEDIDRRADVFNHVEFYDASLRDGIFKESAVADNEKMAVEERRRPLLAIDPLFAKKSELPPVPSVEDLTIESVAMNLPAIAKISLSELLGEPDVSKAAPANTAEPETGRGENGAANSVAEEQGGDGQ